MSRGYRWTEDMQATLEHCLAKRMTAAEAARAISKCHGLSISRNAVIGKALRLGLELCSGKTGGPQRTLAERVAHRLKVEAARKARTERERLQRQAERKKVDNMDAIRDEPKPRGDVPDGCQWLHGEPSERNFCGHPVVFGSSYCAHHRARSIDKAGSIASWLRYTQRQGEAA